MFLKRVPNDSKLVLSVVFCTLIGGIGLGLKKLTFDSDIILTKKNKNFFIDNKPHTIINLDDILSQD